MDAAGTPGYPTHQSIVTVDVEGFSDPHRDNTAQLAVRDGLYRVLEESFDMAGVPWSSCYHEDRGDGVIVLVPASIPKVLLLDPLIGCLSSALSSRNRQVSPAERARLRLVIHAGEIFRDEHGLSGGDLVTACRMLDADELRAALRRSRSDLVIAVSDLIYDGIVRHRFRDIDPTTYHPARVRVKKSSIHMWIHLPGDGAAHRTAEPPLQLPMTTGTFVGRERELAALDAVAGNLVVLTGPPGVGKSALAQQWARRIVDRHPDGQLYADLGGLARPVPPELVLQRFLCGLGVSDEEIPVGMVEQTALYRRLTAQRRLVVVLDNVTSAAAARALLPAPDGNMTVVTGGSRLGTLAADGARILTLAPLSRRDGVEFLARCVGWARIAAESTAADQLVRLCGGLPVALCVAGARLATRPRWTVQQAVVDLLSEHRRLARLSFGDDLSVRAMFDVSYQALSRPAARLYRLLGLHPGPSFDVGVAAAMFRSRLVVADELMEELLHANLVEESHAGRYRFHELVRLHARERTDLEDDPGERDIAVRRALDWYLHTATAADRLTAPRRTTISRDIEHVPLEPISFATAVDAVHWMDSERVNVFVAARYAFEHGMPTKTWQLADAMWGLFLLRARYADWLRFDLLAVRAARRMGDRMLEAESEDRLAMLYYALRHNGEALKHMARAARLWLELTERRRAADSLERFGLVLLGEGRVELATDHFRRVLELYRAAGEATSTELAVLGVGREPIGEFTRPGNGLPSTDALEQTDRFRSA